jgi:hypothetical protein
LIPDTNMKTNHPFARFRTPLALSLGILFSCTAQAAETGTLREALEKGSASLNNRLRYEWVQQGKLLDDAHALTIRTRLGYKTGTYSGLQLYLEAENVTALVDEYADSLGSNPGNAVVIDPEVTEINQFWLQYGKGKTLLKAGRQSLVFDNARFIGDVGWRQDQQTFDALLIQDRSIDKLTLSYAYLWEILRIQADERNWDSDSHLLHANYSGLPFGTLSAYAHVLDLSAATASTLTYGASLSGSQAIDDWKLLYRFEYAQQEDYADHPTAYQADYVNAELGAGIGKWTVAAGIEILENRFVTPLATVHAFNGWSDFRLPVTGNPGGLVDSYLKISGSLPGGVQALAFYHLFESDINSTDYGSEWDLQLVKKLNANMTVLAKTAWFDGKSGLADLSKCWLQFEYNF